MKKRDIFVYGKNIAKLLKCGETKSFCDLRKVRRTLGIIAPKKLTVDHVCLYYGITKEQYWETQEDGNNDE